MNWGHGIILAFVCFGLIIFSLVAISMNQEINLVSKDYYKQEIEFQNQIDKQKNYELLTIKPKLIVNTVEKKINLTFPDSSKVEGEIHLYRASDYKLDQKYSFNYHSVIIDMEKLKPGLWSALVSWNCDGKEYFFKETFFR